MSANKMRTIKFKARSWNNKYWITFDLQKLSQGGFDDVDHNKVCQYTGHKAKEVEIYEGDIIKLHQELPHKDIIGIVKMINGSWMIDKKWELYSQLRGVTNPKVIGNIYEPRRKGKHGRS